MDKTAIYPRKSIILEHLVATGVLDRRSIGKAKRGFVFANDDQEEPSAEVDGDLIIQELPRAVGAISGDEDVFAVCGQYFAYTLPSPDDADTVPDSTQVAGTSADDQPKKTSFFGRLFGKK